MNNLIAEKKPISCREDFILKESGSEGQTEDRKDEHIRHCGFIYLFILKILN